jgi:excisionase family DNA binding protein
MGGSIRAVKDAALEQVHDAEGALPVRVVASEPAVIVLTDQVDVRRKGRREGPAPRPLSNDAGGDDQRTLSAAQGISAGQVFADILLLAAQSCQAPFAVVSVPQPGGLWTTLSHGFEHRTGLNDPRLFDELARRMGPVELADLPSTPGLAGSPLIAAPHEVRWAYGLALRGPTGTVLGVVAVLDRVQRDASRRERRAMLAVARQMTSHLSQLRKVVVASAAWPTPSDRGLYPVANAARSASAAAVASVRRAVSLPEGQQLLRSHEVAVLFDVTERTVINWAAGGKLASLRTIGGHLRFRSEDVLELLAGRSSPAGSVRADR